MIRLRGLSRAYKAFFCLTFRLRSTYGASIFLLAAKGKQLKRKGQVGTKGACGEWIFEAVIEVGIMPII
jgi:hypothetical protein